MGEIIIPYAPRRLQQAAHSSLKRWNILVCHRRWGKTVFAVNELIRCATLNVNRAPRYAYIAPLYRQAKQVAWDYLKYYTAPIPGCKPNEAELRIDLPNGARIQLFGADTPDSLRGIYLDGVVLDEYAQMSPSLFAEVIRPALADRKGWAIWIGTPKGKNSFYDLFHQNQHDDDWFVKVYKASETGIVPEDELDAARKLMSDDEFAQEFECSWAASIRGAYYGKLVEQAESEHRICSVPYEPVLKVTTVWDLGIGDATAIWFLQQYGKEVRLIDYYEASGEGLAHYVQVLQSKGYDYKRHVAPHDISVKELGSGKSRHEIARSLGIDFDIAPQLAVDDGINAVRQLLPRCWFDREKTAYGLDCLRSYRKEWDEKRQDFRNRPLHDYTSHCADAFRYLAVSIEDDVAKKKQHTPQYSGSWMGM